MESPKKKLPKRLRDKQKTAIIYARHYKCLHGNPVDALEKALRDIGMTVAISTDSNRYD